MMPVVSRLFFVVMLLWPGVVHAAISLENLRVEYGVTPLGIDVEKPRFSWQMKSEERGVSQSAWQVQVTDPQGALVWDSTKVSGGNSLGILYAGAALRPATRYTWKATAWDQNNASASASSWFETGLMNPSVAAWEGAAWIGVGSEAVPLYSRYLSVYALRYTVAIAAGSSRASFVFAANDPRLMDPYKNIQQLKVGHNQSYFKVELDVGPVDGSENGRARLNIYRAGYGPGDDPARPLRTLEIGTQTINAQNKHAPHAVAIRAELGQIAITIDGAAPSVASTAPSGRGRGGGAIPLNPAGNGGDYITFGMLCDIGFTLDAGQEAAFSSVEVAHVRSPGNTLFRERVTPENYGGIFREAAGRPGSGLRIGDGVYQLSGGTAGVFITADPSRNSVPMLRTRFNAENKPIRAARLYVTARGIYEIALNGQRVGDDYYNPGLTQYNKTHLYQTYDVTGLITPGSNALGAMLGEGWWSGLLSYGTIWNHFGDRPSLLAKLVVTYEDGTRTVVTTNPRDWKTWSAGPIRYSSLFMGEVYDARAEQEISGWSTAAFEDRRWEAAVEVPLEGTAYRNNMPYDKLQIIGQIGETAGIYQTLSAKTVREVRPGVFLYDLGQNIVGVPRITIASGQQGRPITLRFAEMLYPDLPASGRNVGMIMTENYRAALSQDIYIQRGGRQVYQPRFTFHGFQYIEITGIDAPLPLEAVQGVAISSLRKLTSEFECSNPGVNRLWSNLCWSNIDNFLSIPTDCPQRNERMGWSGDISVFSRTATYLSNADGFLRRHLRAMRDTQTPQGRFTDIAPVGGGFGGILWGSAGMTIPWECYLQYGDTGLLEEHYDAMAAYIRYLGTTINAETGLISDAQLGDWLGPQNNQLSSAFLATAYHVFDLEIMANVAQVLGKAEDAAMYRKMHEERKSFFNRTFVNAEKKAISPAAGGGRGRGAGNAGFRVSDTQTAYAVGLALNAFSEELRKDMAANLAAAVDRENRDDGNILRPRYSLMTGFIGTAWISQALSENGYSELAYRQLQNRQYPSWLYSVDQGATTIWERLNGYTVENGFGGNNGMNSFNHYSFGAVGQWMMAYCLGIHRDQPGFKKFILRPEPDPSGQTTWARGSYESPYGTIRSGWKVENNALVCELTVPANTTATLYLPASAADRVVESGRPAAQSAGVKFIAQEGGKARFELASGTYSFTSPR